MSTLLSSRSNSHSSPLRRMLAVIIALAGAAYTVAGAKGVTDSVCVTAGCALYKGQTFFGYSVWWLGTAGFALIALLAIFNRMSLARFAAGMGLLIDVGLLALLAITSPCLACLFAGFLLLLLFLVLAVPMGLLGRTVVIAWLLVFSPNVIGSMRSVTSPWPIYGQADAPMRLFFSPSCPACMLSTKESLEAYPEYVALFPVAESDADKRKIAALVRSLAEGKGMPQDLRAFFAGVDADTLPEPGTELRWKLFRNRLALYSYSGGDTIPFMMITGRPGPLVPEAQEAPATPAPAQPDRPMPLHPGMPGMSHELPPAVSPPAPRIPKPIFPQTDTPSPFSGCTADEPCPDPGQPNSDKELP